MGVVVRMDLLQPAGTELFFHRHARELDPPAAEKVTMTIRQARPHQLGQRFSDLPKTILAFAHRLLRSLAVGYIGAIDPQPLGLANITDGLRITGVTQRD